MRFVPENIGSKFIAAMAILLFVLSSPSKSFIWHLPSVDYIEIASGESRADQNRNLECASSSAQSFGGRIKFQNSSGKDVGFIPFNIKPFGLLKKSIKFKSFTDNYGSFRLEVDYRFKRSLNCYITLDPTNILIPFDHEQKEDSYLALGSESQNRTAAEVQLSIANLSKTRPLKLTSKIYGKDGTELSELNLTLKEIPALGRYVEILPKDILSKAGLIKIQNIEPGTAYSAFIKAEGLDEEHYNPTYIATSSRGTCKNKKFHLNLETYEEPLVEIVNVSTKNSRAFLSVISRSGEKMQEDSVLIPAGATFPFRVDSTSGSVNISCDQGELMSITSWQNDETYTLSTENSYTSVSLPIIKSKGIKNIIRLNSESTTPSLVNISLYSITGEKLFTPFQEIELQGNLAIPLDQHLGPKFNAVAVITSKRNAEDLVRVSLIRKEDSDESILKFPDALLTAKEEKPIEKLEQITKRNIEIPENLVVRREKDLLTLINDKDFDSHCVNRTRSAVPDAIIKHDALEFDLNLRKLLKHGVSEVKTYQISNLEQFTSLLEANNYFLQNEVKLTNNKSLVRDHICLSLLYSNRNNEISDYAKEISSLSFDFRKVLVKGTLEKKLKLDGTAWLKAVPDSYFFCFRTAGDCEINKNIPTQYTRSFVSPTKMTSLKASNYYPLLTIDRPFKVKSKSKDFKIKAYLHSKVPYEILATVTGIKAKDKNEVVNCKDLNGKYRLHFSGSKWINARQSWERTQKFDLNLSYNPVTFVHSGNASAGPEVADNCNKFFKDCHIGIWTINVANGLSSGSEPHGWGRFTQNEKFAYRWSSLPLLEGKEIEFNKFELSNSNDQPKCDYSKAKVKLKASSELTTVPEVIAKREEINTYLLPRKIYHPDTYPVNQPAPGIPYPVESNLNPYVYGENRMTLATSTFMSGTEWLDEIPE